MNDYIEDVTVASPAAGYRRGRAALLPPGRWRHRAVRRLRQGDPALRGPHRRRDPHGPRRRVRPPRGARPRAAAIGIVGFCFGGRVTFLAAARARVRRRGRLLRRRHRERSGSRSSRRWSGRPAAADAVARAVRRRGRRRSRSRRSRRCAPRSRRRRSTTEIVRYADAEHGFHCDVAPSRTDEASAQDAWQRTLDWFGEPPRGGAVTDAVELVKSDDCDLCEAARITPWFHEDDVCWIAECEICAVPMVVWRCHGTEPPAERLEHMHGGSWRRSSATTYRRALRRRQHAQHPGPLPRARPTQGRLLRPRLPPDLRIRARG